MKISATNSIMNIILLMMMVVTVVVVDASGDTNRDFHPCLDTKIQRSDGFTFGIVFASNKSFSLNTNNSIQLSPCDTRLSLQGSSRVAVFRPKVDEISLLTINTSSFDPASSGGYMVAFAGRKYAARSLPVFVGDNDHIVTSFTLVLEFQKGTLQNLFWKNDKCDSCKGMPNFVCIKNRYCAIKKNSCKLQQGKVDCSLGIQLAFSGTDKHLSALNSWYEVERLRQYSLYKLYSNLRGSLTDQFSNFF